MYPGDEECYYGTFVRESFAALLRNDFCIEKVVIKGRSRSTLEKLKKYIFFLFQAVREIKRNDYDLIYVHYLNHSVIPLCITKPFPSKHIILNIKCKF